MKKVFKLVLCMIMSITMLISLSACGEKEKGKVEKETSNNFSGTWKVDYIDCEGSKFTVDEWIVMEDEDLSKFYIILKDGGKAYIYDGDFGDLENWLKSDNSIMIGDEKCSIVDGKICFDYYGDTIYLHKTSDNQEIPKEDDSDDAEENIEDEEETVSSTEISTEFKDSMDGYEKFFDEYISIVKKYKDNPTDISILSDYSNYISQYTEIMADFEAWEDEELTTAELAYYIEVQGRIAQKLLEISQ